MVNGAPFFPYLQATDFCMVKRPAPHYLPPVTDAIDPIVSPGEVQNLNDLVLVDARSGPQGRDRHAASHLQGAVHADLDRDLSAEVVDAACGGRHPLPDVQRFCEQLGHWGIGPKTHVVIYDDQGGANAAARLWWMLRALGHQHVQVLDGGLAAAQHAGLPLSAEPPTPVAQPAYPADAFAWPTASMAQVEPAASDPRRLVLDVRAAPRFRGEHEPIDPAAGHIPGAENLPLGHNLDEQGRFKTAEQLRAQYRELLAGRPVSDAIVHCGSGVTACHTLLAMERAGLPGAALYVGSFSEWCRNDQPIGKA